MRHCVYMQKNQTESVRQRLFALDLAACVALERARKAEVSAARLSAKNNPGLCAALLSDAQRRGGESINWDEYFLQMGMY